MPYVHLFEQKSTSRYSLSLDPPIRGVEKFAAGEVDAALLPVAALRSLSRPFKRVPFGIASVGQVRSVLLLSQCEVHEIEELFLDYQSVTSVQLLRVLMRSHWQCTAELLPASVGYETEICGARGGLVIGDRALQHSRCFDHVYDLGAAWYDYTDLPFVFAMWVVAAEVGATQVAELCELLALAEQVDVSEFLGLVQIDIGTKELTDYLCSTIRYRLDADMLAGLSRFEEELIHCNLQCTQRV